MNAGRGTATGVPAALEALETLLAASPARGAEAARTAALEAARSRLDAAVAADPDGARRLGARIAAVGRRTALAARAVPTGLLDGLLDAVRAETAVGGRPALSAAFLDAPRSLARWRWTAVAACTVLAVGTLAGGGAGVWFDAGGAAPSGVRALGDDPRDGILDRLDRPAQGAAAPGPRGAPGVAVRSARYGGPQTFRVEPGTSADAARLLDAMDVRLFPVPAAVPDRERN